MLGSSIITAMVRSLPGEVGRKVEDELDVLLEDSIHTYDVLFDNIQDFHMPWDNNRDFTQSPMYPSPPVS